MITCGLVQASSHPDASQNFHTIKHFVTQAKKNHCRVLCFPEAFLTGYFPKEASELALSSDCELLKQISELAQEEQIDLLIGFMEKNQNSFFLTHGIFSADGTVQFYCKTHLGRLEEDIFTPGIQLNVFSLSCGLTIGIQLCVETHFPEITQTLSLKGAQVIFAPHAVPPIAGDRQKIWSKYIPARSYDNRIYMACCNQWNGGCYVTDPQGDVIASSFQEQPELVCFEVSPEKIACYHNSDMDFKHRYYPALRKPDLYQM